MERYEITTYENLIDMAEHLNVSQDAVNDLRTNLQEEQSTFERLKDLARNFDVEAIGGGEFEEEEAEEGEEVA